LKPEAAHASIPIINHDSLLQLQTGSSGEVHDFIRGEDVAAGADCRTIQVPFCADLTVAFSPREEIMKPSGARGENSIRAHIVTMVYVQKEFAVLCEE